MTRHRVGWALGLALAGCGSAAEPAAEEPGPSRPAEPPGAAERDAASPAAAASDGGPEASPSRPPDAMGNLPAPADAPPASAARFAALVANDLPLRLGADQTGKRTWGGELDRV